MSYILDALKRADAERGQRATPLLTGEAPLAEAAPARKTAITRAWLIGTAALALVAAGVWAWQSFRSTTTQPAAPAVGSTSPAAANQPPTVEPASAPTVATPPSAPETATSPKPPAPVLPILSKAPPPPPPAKPRPAPATTAEATPTATSSSKPPPLTAAQKAALPRIEVSGSSYSANPAHRMLIVNDQLVKEGEELAPGLTLEAIGPHSTIFNQRGTRFNVNY